jgi:hypothetical protein
METITPQIVDENLQLVIKENNLELESAQFLVVTFEPLLKQAHEWAAKVANINVTDASQTREMKLARETRLALREIRIKTEKARKSLGEEGVRRNRAINGAANIIKFLVEPLEEKLEAQEKFVELQEAKRKSELKQTRLMLLAPYAIDTSFYDLGEMPENVFNQLLESTKLTFESKQKEVQRLEQERIDSEKKKAEEQERIRLENEKLKAEAQARETAAQIERHKAAEALKAAQEAARKEKEAAERAMAAKLAEERKKAAEAAAKLAEEQKAAREASEKKLKAEREAREALEAKVKAQEEATRRAQEAEKAKQAAAAGASDNEKLIQFAKDIRALKIPNLNAQELPNLLKSQTEKFAQWVEKQIK